MTLLSMREIAGVAQSAGFSSNPDTWATAVAIAEAESSGNSMAVNPENCVGLWQINQTAHPQWSVAQLQNPVTNAVAAYSVSSQGTDFQPWSTYTSGSYKLFLMQAKQAIQDPTAPQGDTNIPGQSPQGSILGPLQGIASLGEALSNPQTWVRVAEALAGFALILFALIKMSANTRIGKTAKHIGKDAAIGAVL